VIDELKRNDHGAALDLLCTGWKSESLQKLAIGILKRRWLNDDELEALISEPRALRQQRDEKIGSRRDETPVATISGTSNGSQQTGEQEITAQGRDRQTRRDERDDLRKASVARNEANRP
jgi:hypothetical protein